MCHTGNRFNFPHRLTISSHTAFILKSSYNTEMHIIAIHLEPQLKVIVFLQSKSWNRDDGGKVFRSSSDSVITCWIPLQHVVA